MTSNHSRVSSCHSLDKFICHLLAFISLWGRFWKWISTSLSRKLSCLTSQINPVSLILSLLPSIVSVLSSFPMNSALIMFNFSMALLNLVPFAFSKSINLDLQFFHTGLPGLGVSICSSKLLFFKFGIRNFRILHFLTFSPFSSWCHSERKEGEKNSYTEKQRDNDEKKFYENNM